MNKRLLRYYKKKMYGGRSLAARLIDLVFFRAVIFIILFFAAFYILRSLTLALLISVFITAAVSFAVAIIKRKKALKFMEKDLLRIKKKCLLETLTFMSKEEFAKYINSLFENKFEKIELTSDGFTAQYDKKAAYVLHNYPSGKCEAERVLAILRSFEKNKDVLIISLCEFTEDAKKMCARLPGRIELIPGSEVLKIAGERKMLPDEKTAQENAKKEMEEKIITFEEFKKTAFSRVKIKGYIICGIAIMCWPLISGFKFYYPLIALLCFALAIFTYKKSKTQKQNRQPG